MMLMAENGKTAAWLAGANCQLQGSEHQQAKQRPGQQTDGQPDPPTRQQPHRITQTVHDQDRQRDDACHAKAQKGQVIRGQAVANAVPGKHRVQGTDAGCGQPNRNANRQRGRVGLS